MTTDRSADLAPKLAAPQAEDIGIRQGILRAWNPSTGANTVEMGGTLLTDLPVQASGSLAMAVGDTVALLRYGNTFFIVGVVRAAGTGAMSSRGDRVTFGGSGSDAVTSTSFVSPATSGPIVTDVYIGKSRQCKVEISALMQVSDCTGYVGFSVNGASTINADDFRGAILSGANADIWLGTQATRTVLLNASDGLNEGFNTFTTRVKRIRFPGNAGFFNVADRDLIVTPF